MGRAEEFYGAGDVDRMFPGGAPTTVVPWQRAGRRKDVKDYDAERVQAVLQKPQEHELVDIDPRNLRATQPSLTRAGVKHYLSDEYQRSGKTFADRDQKGNQYPMVYHRDGGQQLLLSGHHRAAAALLQGRQFKGYVVEGPWGAPR
jgi:hypothetical protein